MLDQVQSGQIVDHAATESEASKSVRVSDGITVLPVSFSDILDAPNAETLLQAYSEECLVPDASPQRLIYEALERANSLRCFAAYSSLEGRLFLVGFVSVLVAVMPHHGQRLATVESLFVEPSYRDTGAGNTLLAAAEQHALQDGCSALVCVARAGSRFEKVLIRRAGYEQTHSQHTKWLVNPEGQ